MTELHQFSILDGPCRFCSPLSERSRWALPESVYMNIMLVAVQQRTREIGIENALGAQRKHILTQFLAEAMVITGVGGFCGVTLA